MMPEIERQSAETIKAFQEAQLQVALQYLWEQSPFYHKLLKQHHIAISDIKTLEDLCKIPTTSKDDLQKYNDDFLCVPKHQVIDYVTTSGTLGEPVTFALSDKDLDRLAYNEALSFGCTGMTADDTIQLMTTMDRRFMAGLAYFLGARKLGASIIRVGAGVPELQWDSITKFHPTYLVGVPSFILKLIAYANLQGIELNNSNVRGIICIGEPVRNSDFSLNALGQSIIETWNVHLYSTYASTEMSTAFTECSAQQGGHLQPELIIVEVLDAQQQPVANGELGELTITTLGVEAMPLLRFRTGDMVRAHHRSCKCGRNTLRLGPVEGRKQQMIKYKGTTLYPPAVLNVLNHFKIIDGYVIELTTTSLGTDDLIIKVATSKSTEDFLHEIQDHFRAKLRVKPTIEFCDMETIQKLQYPNMGRKPVMVIDRRK
ncbi:MAG TPA: AMP-binding protein [Aquaticitalea sp.]|nr:AMP-binding protein [Aquaticitalea sp.]